MAFKFDWSKVDRGEAVEALRRKINEAVTADPNAAKVGAFHVSQLSLGTVVGLE